MQTFRARSSVVWGWIAVGAGAALALLHLATVGFSRGTGGFGLGVAAIAVGTAAFLRPRVETHGDAVVLRNTTHAVSIPFARLGAIETRWSLTLVDDAGRRWGAFAAPAPGAAASMRRPAGEDDASLGGRPSDRPGTASGDAAAMVHDAWEAWRAGHPDGESDAAVERTPDLVGVALAVLAIAGGAWGLFG